MKLEKELRRLILRNRVGLCWLFYGNQDASDEAIVSLFLETEKQCLSRKPNKQSTGWRAEIGDSMSFDIMAEPQVKSPGTARPRRGRGFSIEELKQAGLLIRDGRNMGLIVDLRRKTLHPENVEVLKQFDKDLKNLVAEISKPSPKPQAAKRDEKAIDELSSLRAVKKAEAEQLVAAGIKTVSDLAYCEIDKVSKKTGIDEDRLTTLVKAALKKA